MEVSVFLRLLLTGSDPYLVQCGGVEIGLELGDAGGWTDLSLLLGQDAFTQRHVQDNQDLAWALRSIGSTVLGEVASRVELVRAMPVPLRDHLLEELRKAQREQQDRYLEILRGLKELAADSRLRSKWALLQKFPTLPPFGESWFTAIRLQTPLGVLREAWIYRNIELDDAEKAEFQKSVVELQGFYNNPEFYWRVQEHKKGEAAMSNAPFRVVFNTDEFQRKLSRAMAGDPDILPPNPEIAARVAAKRLEMAKQQEEDPRIISAIEDVADPNAEMLNTHPEYQDPDEAALDESSGSLEVVEKNK